MLFTQISLRGLIREGFFFSNLRKHEREVHVDLKSLIYHKTTKS